MIADSAWVILGQETLRKPPLGWLPLNLGFTTALFLTIHPGWNPDISAPILAIICIIRTLIDYFGFHDLYFPKQLTP